MIVGPGYLKDLENSFNKKSLVHKTPEYTLPKSKIIRKAEEVAKSHSFVPGVGYYKNCEKAFTSHIIIPKERVPFISKSKDIRFIESFSASKKWIPGPGSYEFDPQPIIKKK